MVSFAVDYRRREAFSRFHLENPLAVLLQTIPQDFRGEKYHAVMGATTMTSCYLLLKALQQSPFTNELRGGFLNLYKTTRLRTHRKEVALGIMQPLAELILTTLSTAPRNDEVWRMFKSMLL